MTLIDESATSQPGLLLPDMPSQTRLTSIVSAVVAAYREHCLLFILSASYIVLGGLFLTILGRPWPIRLATS